MQVDEGIHEAIIFIVYLRFPLGQNELIVWPP